MLGKDLHSGVLIKQGLILSVDMSDNNFWGGPNMTYISNDDAYYGPVSCELDPEEEFDVLCELGTAEYEQQIIKIARELMDYARERMDEASTIIKLVR